MSKRSKTSAVTASHSEVGIDVSKGWLDVSHQRAGTGVKSGRFDNEAQGHRSLIRWLRKASRGTSVRIIVEATGTYHLDVSQALHEAGMAVMVINPRVARNFSQTLMQRTRTDLTAATSLREYCARMEFTPWEPPRAQVRELRAVGRRLQALTEERTAERNRLHAVKVSREHSEIVRRDLELNIRHLTERMAALLEQAEVPIAADPELRRRYEQLQSVKGFGRKSAVCLLGELAMLPADMGTKQWVAHSGLDPSEQSSGSSVQRRPRISKQGNRHLRAALYMPALVAKQWDPNVRAFSQKLLAKKKAPLQITVAVMRKLLHAIHGMFASGTNFDGEKFYRIPPQQAA